MVTIIPLDTNLFLVQHEKAVMVESASVSLPIDVLIVDDHLLVSETMAVGLQHAEGFEVETATDLPEAIAKIGDRGSYRVVLLDYNLPGVNGLEALSRMVELNGGGVALFSGVAGLAMVPRAIEQGAAGFIPKSLPMKMLGQAVRFIADGGVYVPYEYMRRLSQGDGNSAGLKEREMRVLSFLCEGMPNKAIGRELGIDEIIVKMDVKAICRKLGVRNRTQAVLEARKRGLS